MASKKKKKFQRQEKVTKPPALQQEIKKRVNPIRFALIITGIFFLVALFGMLHHEMWRDEHQAWLVARDANSIGDVFKNMRYEGNPALWHLFLFIITRFTHNPAYMQAFHLLIASGSIFLFNRYAPIGRTYKILFSFSYFPLYEYAIISRSYSLGILFAFAICALYKKRTSYYLWIGILLALLANVTIYAALIAIGIGGVLFLDYIFNQQKSNKLSLQLSVALVIALVGIIFSFYQIIPDKDNSFPAMYVKSAFDSVRWSLVGSKLFTTYFYIPDIQENFWNTNVFLPEQIPLNGLTFAGWLHENPAYYWGYVYMPILLFISGCMIFLRKPMILLLYSGLTLALVAVNYYTFLMHSRYCGYLLIALIISYWLAEYYPEKKYENFFLRKLSVFGKKISKGFLFLLLSFNVVGAIIAYAMDYQYKFSTSKDAANYIKENKLDTLEIDGATDFVISPLATYLNKKIYYPQMKDYGSFTIWNKKRITQPGFDNLIESVKFLMKDKNKILLVKDMPPRVTFDGKNYQDIEHAMFAKDLQVDLIKKFVGGIVSDEQYYIYLVQRTDSSKVDFSKYMRLY